MRHSTKSWVIYRMTLHNDAVRRPAVCLQSEWDAMEKTRPGYHSLIQAGVPSEGEAERLARELAIATRTQPLD
jgi:hypothetical protein